MSNDCPAAWPANASLAVAAEYPFTSPPSDETPSDFVVRAYYETLWMPEIIMPLEQFIPTVRRVVPSPDTSIALLHTLVAPIIRSVDGIANKYRNDIPEMIVNDGAGEDAEEAMILFAWTREKRSEDSKDIGTEEEKESRWTKRWLQRFERRDAMIQVLLHFLILSLPTPTPSPLPSADKKRKRQRKRKDMAPNLQENLEVLIDRLCIWRETDFASSDSFTGPSTFSERDWLQAFCEDVVRPAFHHLLPPLYESLREKCFPESVGENLSESESDPIASRSQQPSAEPAATAASSASLMKRKQSMTAPRHGGTDPSGLDLMSLLPSRTFSRSNSITSNNSQLLNSRREVSMRRSVSVQRDVSAGAGKGKGKGKERELQLQGANKTGTSLSNNGTTRTARSSSFSAPRQTPDHQPFARSATTLVPETPLRGGRNSSRLLGRTMTLNDLGRAQSSQLLNGFFSEDGDDPGGMVSDEPEQASVFDAEGPSQGRSRSGSETVVLVQSTPVRPRSHPTRGPLAPQRGFLGGLNRLGAGMIPETPAR